MFIEVPLFQETSPVRKNSELRPWSGLHFNNRISEFYSLPPMQIPALDFLDQMILNKNDEYCREREDLFEKILKHER